MMKEKDVKDYSYDFQKFLDSPDIAEYNRATEFTPADYDFQKFLDSPDIAEYNRATEFTPAEQAIFISMNWSQTVEEKVRALQYLVDTYSDEEFHTKAIIQSLMFDEKEESLKEAVCCKIKIWKKVLEDRYDADGVIFAARLNEEGFQDSDVRSVSYFTSYEKAYDYLVREKKEYTDDEDLRDVILHARIWRIKTDCDGRRMGKTTYFFNNELELVYVYERSDHHTTHDIAGDFYVHVPMPFKRGDLVKEVSPSFQVNYGILAGDYGEADREWHKRIGFGDCGDMIVNLNVYNKELGIWEYYDHACRLRLQYCTEAEQYKYQYMVDAWKERLLSEQSGNTVQ